jgi:hypothetical protein
VSIFGIGCHAERGSAVIGSKEGRICAQVSGQDHQVVAEDFCCWLFCAFLLEALLVDFLPVFTMFSLVPRSRIDFFLSPWR